MSALYWRFSRNQLRHWVCDGSFYTKGKKTNGGYELFEIRTGRPKCKIRTRNDTFQLLHKGRQVDSHKIVKVLKASAEDIYLRDKAKK